MAVIKRTCCLQVVLAMAHGFGDVMPMELSDKMKKVVWQWPIWDTSHRKRNGKKIWRPNRLCWILCSIHSMPWKWGHRPWPKCCWWWFPGLLSFFCWISQRGEDPNDWFAEGWKTTTKNGFQNQPSQIWLRGNVQCSQLAATIWVSSKAWWWFHSEIRLSYLISTFLAYPEFQSLCAWLAALAASETTDETTAHCIGERLFQQKGWLKRWSWY